MVAAVVLSPSGLSLDECSVAQARHFYSDALRLEHVVDALKR
ncbi:hypothetical protein [Deinococcus proteolyticus]|nr:hypothetical protein [Deinococcus proteolyticus]